MNQSTPKRAGAYFPILAILGALVALSFPALKLAIDVGASTPSALLTADAVRLVVSIVVAVVACVTLIGGRYASLSFAVYLFALSRAAQPATLWAMLLPRGCTWIGVMAAALIAGSSIYGFVALCLRMPSGEAVGRWRPVNRVLPVYAALVGALYGASAYRGFWLDAYAVFAALIWLGYLVGLLAYLERRRTAVGEELLRTRWVAVAIFVHVAIEATFLALNIHGQTVLSVYLFVLNPAPYAFAYALVRGRIVDVRVFGGRALVYAALTSVPIAGFAVLDLLFAKELESVKLASLAEAGVAVAFSFWLQSLHRKIERLVERVFFARRHHAHAAIEQMIVALPFVERPGTLERMLVEDVYDLLEFFCAAIYCSVDRGFELRAAAGCEGLPPILDPDDPLVLYPRSSRSLVALRDVPASRVALPAGDSAPAFALPILGGNRTYAIVLYGERRSAEPIDAEEERLLLRLAHGAANAYEHLLLLQREREIDALRSRLDAAAAAGAATRTPHS